MPASPSGSIVAHADPRDVRHLGSASETMIKTITGIFANRVTAELAVMDLAAIGFRADRVAILDARHLGRSRWIARRIADTWRAISLGAVVGAGGGLILGAAFGAGSLWIAGISTMMLALGGALLGALVGRSTESQMQAELENEVAAGRVLVSVISDEDHASMLGKILARSGRPYVVSTRAGFVGAVLGGTSS